MVAASRVPELAPGEVHAWRFSLAANASADPALELPADELARAGRFVFERDRRRFLRAREAMRTLLGAYLALEPQALEIFYGPQGKPFVDPRYGLGFNMSHSGEHGLIAISRQPHVGVDIEELSAREGLRALADSVFSPAERDAIAAVPEAGLAAAFYNAWTRKEACLKALGMGLAVEPNAVHVGLGSARDWVRLPGASEEIEVASLFEDESCSAALAVAGGYTRFRMLHWMP